MGSHRVVAAYRTSDFLRSPGWPPSFKPFLVCQLLCNVCISCVGKFKHFPQLFFVSDAHPAQSFGMPGQLAGPVIYGAFAPGLMVKQIVPDFQLALFYLHA
jgi:hypothetical protein